MHKHVSTGNKDIIVNNHYRHLDSCSVDSAFDDSWKEEVDEQVSVLVCRRPMWIGYWIGKLRERK